MRRILISFILTLSVFLLAACTSKSVKMTNPEKVPAAEVTLTTDESDDGMVEYKLDVRHLAPADKIDGDATSYVAWIEPTSPTSGPPQNIGALDLQDDLSARLEGKTPFNHFNFFVTTEPTTVATAPSGEKIFESEVSRDTE